MTVGTFDALHFDGTLNFDVTVLPRAFVNVRSSIAPRVGGTLLWLLRIW